MWKAIWKILTGHQFVGGMMLMGTASQLGKGDYGWAAACAVLFALNMAFAAYREIQP